MGRPLQTLAFVKPPPRPPDHRKPPLNPPSPSSQSVDDQHKCQNENCWTAAALPQLMASGQAQPQLRDQPRDGSVVWDEFTSL
jgi:hypothetical protein